MSKRKLQEAQIYTNLKSNFDVELEDSTKETVIENEEKIEEKNSKEKKSQKEKEKI